jgi:DNA-directed RNA polymerase subunit RPC12/RpoP
VIFMIMKIVITETQLMKLVEEEKDHIIKCKQCGWKWKESESGKDKYVCHECGHDNNPKSKSGQPEWTSCKNCKKKHSVTVMKDGRKGSFVCSTCGTHN